MRQNKTNPHHPASRPLTAPELRGAIGGVSVGDDPEAKEEAPEWPDWPGLWMTLPTGTKGKK